MSVALSVSHLGKWFDSATQALDDVSFEIGSQSFVSIVGPSGCGKSTLLRLVAGLAPATTGSIRANGRLVDGPVAGAGMVFQRPVLLPWRTVLENVLFVAEMGGQPARRYEAQARQLLTLAGLQGFEHHYPHALSGGMQQRAAICRALLLQPSLLLMDEPFAALDVMTREQLGFELQRIWGARKSTVLFVTHSITEAALLSDQVLVMSARPGRIERIVDIPLPRPRTAQTLQSPAFLALSATIRDSIERNIQADPYTQVPVS
ncbi:ABC transporter ATP-binding protein [Castellaniella caeni]